MSVTPVGALTTFSPSTDAKSSEVNANFAALKAAFNALVTATDTLAAGLTLVAKMGVSTTSGPLATIFRSKTLSLGNTDAAETDLDSFAFPANAADAADKGIRIQTWGMLNATGNTKTLKFYIAAQSVTVLTSTGNNVPWMVELFLQRGAAATTHEGIAVAHVSGASPTLVRLNSFTGTWASTQTMKFTGQGTASLDIRQLGLTVEYLGT
jgi:hypothetical protein